MKRQGGILTEWNPTLQMEEAPPKEASNPQAKNNAGRQLAIELLWPKPTDFITGPAFEAFEERHDSATFSETDERG